MTLDIVFEFHERIHVADNCSTIQGKFKFGIFV